MIIRERNHKIVCELAIIQRTTDNIHNQPCIPVILEQTCNQSYQRDLTLRRCQKDPLHDLIVQPLDPRWECPDDSCQHHARMNSKYLEWDYMYWSHSKDQNILKAVPR